MNIQNKTKWDLDFLVACEKGDLKLVKYLLTSPEIKEAGHDFANLHENEEEGFRWACSNGHLEVVKYLLISPDLIEAGHTFANVHAVDDDGFRVACSNQHWNVVRWLVMDYGIKKTPAIENILQKHPQAKEYFRVRDELREIQGLLKPPTEHQGKTSNSPLKL